MTHKKRSAYEPMHGAKLLHTMLRVGDMQRSINFYTRILGMRVLRTVEQASERYSLAFLGYADESDSCVLELTYNHGISVYDRGNGYGHIAIRVEDCRQACRSLSDQGVKIIFAPTPLQGCHEIIAFIEDPDGYQIELVQRDEFCYGFP